ncbi:fungal-specific transcription factor domain-containing protein [Aspergillus californicus]
MPRTWQLQTPGNTSLQNPLSGQSFPGIRSMKKPPNPNMEYLVRPVDSARSSAIEKTRVINCIYPESSRKRRCKLPPATGRTGSLESRVEVLKWSLPGASNPAPPKTPILNVPRHPVPEESAETGNQNRENVYHIADNGEVEFQGHTADRSFMRAIESKLGSGPTDMTHQFPTRTSGPALFEPARVLPNEVPLPPKAFAARLIDAAVDAQILYYILHRPSLDVSFNLVYSLNESDYSARERTFLPLLYAIFAYGSLFIDPTPEGKEREELVSQGSNFYAKARQLQDIAECRDITSLQAILFMNLYLFSFNRKSTCYTYLTTSLSFALRMGLHRSLKMDHKNLISQELSKRIFWTLRLLTNDVATFCGLPKLLADEEIDQELPLEVNDVYVERNKILPQPEDEVCYIAGSNAYKRLLMIRDRVTKDVYPVRSHIAVPGPNGSSHTVSMGTIRGIQDDLDNWVRNIPMGYRLGTYDTEAGLMRAQYILVTSYAHVQVYLYRPFLHYAVETPNQVVNTWEGIAPYTTAAVQASENVIALCDEMYRRGLLNGDFCPVARMLVSGTLTILYFILASRSFQTSNQMDSLVDSFKAGRKVLNHLAEYSYPVHRAKVFFTVMISTLPSDLQYVRDRLLDVDADTDGNENNDSRPLHSEQTAWLASKTLSFSPRATSEKGPSTSLTASNIINEGAIKPRTQPSLYPPPQTSSVPAPNPTHLENISSPSGANGVLEAQPLMFRQGSMGETWANAFQMDTVNRSADFQPCAVDMEDMEQFFDFGSWL